MIMEENANGNVVKCSFGRAGSACVLLSQAFYVLRQFESAIPALQKFDEFVYDQPQNISGDDLELLLDMAFFPDPLDSHSNLILNNGRKEAFALFKKYALLRTDLVTDHIMNRLLNEILRPNAKVECYALKSAVHQIRLVGVKLNKANIVLVKQIQDRESGDNPASTSYLDLAPQQENSIDETPSIGELTDRLMEDLKATGRISPRPR